MKLSPSQLDILKEVGSIGAGHSAISLSQLLNRKISMAVTQVDVLPTGEFAKKLTQKEDLVVGSYLKILGEVKGYMELILSRDHALKLSDFLVYQEDRGSKTLYEIGQSALKEVSNIVCSSYLTVLYEMTKITFSSSVPKIVIDWPLGVVAGAYAEMIPGEKESIALVTSIHEASIQLSGYLVFVPDTPSLQLLLKKLEGRP